MLAVRTELAALYESFGDRWGSLIHNRPGKRGPRRVNIFPRTRQHRTVSYSIGPGLGRIYKMYGAAVS